MTLSSDIKQAIELCNTIASKSLNELNKSSNIQDLQELQDAAQSMTNHLDNVITKLSPCKYNVSTVISSIDRFRHYKFKKFSGLCGHNLSPILDDQVEEAIRSADGGMLALKMLIPIIDFFNEWAGSLDDSYGEGGQFVYAWGDKLGDAIDRMPQKIDNEDDLDAIEEILESMKGLGDYGWDCEVKECIDNLEDILVKMGELIIQRGQGILERT